MNPFDLKASKMLVPGIHSSPQLVGARTAPALTFSSQNHRLQHATCRAHGTFKANICINVNK